MRLGLRFAGRTRVTIRQKTKAKNYALLCGWHGGGTGKVGGGGSTEATSWGSSGIFALAVFILNPPTCSRSAGRNAWGSLLAGARAMPLYVGSTGARFEELRAAVAEPTALHREREREREGP